MKITPINKHYVVKLIEQEKKKGSLILIKEDVKQPIYEIIEQHDDAEHDLGDKVILMKYKGQEVKLDDQKYVIVHEDDILAIFEE